MSRTRQLLIIFTTAALLSPALPASAQGSSDSLIRGASDMAAQDPAATGATIDGLLDVLESTGSGDRPLPREFLQDASGYPLPLDPSITEPAVVDRTVEDGRLERWSVASPAMQRIVEVQVYRAVDPATPAPQLILLDGSDGTENTGWLRGGYAQEAFAGENITVVMPTQATGSMYTDWRNVDPALGRMKWETFITEELAPLMAADEALNYNGHRGVGGLSMGAGAAVRMANHHPELFDAVLGISGCYSTLDPYGMQNARLTVESRGADLENMWGPKGSVDWVRNDIVRDPSGLRSLAVYLSSGNGVLGDVDRRYYATYPSDTSAKGAVLERGTLTCTQDLEAAMTQAGMDHQVVDYTPTGAHNWPTFGTQLAPALDAVRHALY